jgi:hypothetical protein
MADSPFDDHGRLLAYVAPNYTETERRTMTRAQRATFNLDLVEAGHAAPFIIYPSLPGELDLPLLLEAASAAVGALRGIWANAETLLAYEYRAAEKLFRVTRKMVNNQPLKAGEARSWRERYCVDLRTRSLHGPEDYVGIAPEYRLWIWPRDLNEAIGRLNLVPSPSSSAPTSRTRALHQRGPVQADTRTVWELARAELPAQGLGESGSPFLLRLASASDAPTTSTVAAITTQPRERRSATRTIPRPTLELDTSHLPTGTGPCQARSPLRCRRSL